MITFLYWYIILSCCISFLLMWLNQRAIERMIKENPDGLGPVGLFIAVFVTWLIWVVKWPYLAYKLVTQNDVDR